jgi:hypothetical protein
LVIYWIKTMPATSPGSWVQCGTPVMWSLPWTKAPHHVPQEDDVIEHSPVPILSSPPTWNKLLCCGLPPLLVWQGSVSFMPLLWNGESSGTHRFNYARRCARMWGCLWVCANVLACVSICVNHPCDHKNILFCYFSITTITTWQKLAEFQNTCQNLLLVSWCCIVSNWLLTGKCSTFSLTSHVSSRTHDLLLVVVGLQHDELLLPQSLLYLSVPVKLVHS